ncbi:cyclin-L1-1-like [Tripterygium wilfordii]|uniref:cyclin-L1-1-like n=1 Tax=Tripterygium wilfordii TaxID=458696 RepID=UPI0018F7EAE0|nr:cyclin-L1-1-like [Tripterygium wilfordii]
MAAPAYVNLESGGSMGVIVKVELDKLKESKKSDDESKNMPSEGDTREETVSKYKSEHRIEASGERSKEWDRDRESDRTKSRGRDRGRDTDREREREEVERDKGKDRGPSSRERLKASGGHSDKSRHHSSGQMQW